MATATGKSEERTVVHALFEYIDQETGLTRLALRGEKILLAVEDIARGEKFGAFLTKEQTATVFPTTAPLATQVEWLIGHSLQEAVAAVDKDRSAAAPMLVAEQTRTDAPARPQLVQVLTSATS